MKMNKFQAFSIILLLSVVVSAARGGCSSVPPQVAAMTKAPDFTLDLFTEETPMKLTLSEINRDRPVLLVFWASWCPTCVSEIPDINAWQKKNWSTRVKVLGVNLEETQERVKRIQTRYPMDYEVVMDSDGEVAEQYQIDSLPTLVLLAKGGEILYYGFQLPRDTERLLSQKN